MAVARWKRKQAPASLRPQGRPHADFFSALRLATPCCSAGRSKASAFAAYVEQQLVPDSVAMTNLGRISLPPCCRLFASPEPGPILLPYSPDLNPIERTLATIRDWIRNFRNWPSRRQRHICRRVST